MQRVTGLMRSGEFRSLSTPLAVLLAMVFTLSVHLNASFAANSDSSLCLWAGKYASTDINGQTQVNPNTHCSLCTISDELDSALLSSSAGIIARNQSSQQKISKFLLEHPYQFDSSQIRAPPVS